MLQKRIGELQEQQAVWKEEPQQLAQAQAAHDKLLDSQKKTESIAKNLIPAWRRKQQELEEAQSEYRKSRMRMSLRRKHLPMQTDFIGRIW